MINCILNQAMNNILLMSSAGHQRGEESEDSGERHTIVIMEAKLYALTKTT